MQLDSLKEDPDEAQAKMHNEKFENIKLVPILTEAYELVCLIESHQKKAKKDIAALERQKKELRDKQTKLKTISTIEDQAANTRELFKTIMCPLNEACPNDTRDRWPKSSAKSTT